MKRPRAADALAPAQGAAAAAAAGPDRSLVALELGALLEEVAAPGSAYAQPATEGFLALLRAQLCALPACDVTADAHEAAHPGLPLRRLAGGAVATLRFAAPASVRPVGSYASRTLLKPAACVDVLVTMPAGCFRERDIKSFAYADKRAMYLGALAAALLPSGLCASVEACALGGDVSKPALLLTPAPTAAAAALAAGARGAHGGGAAQHTVPAAAKALGRLRVRLIPALAPSASSLFPASALSPAWNNVRVSTLAGVPAGAAPSGASGADAADAPATPHYTAAVTEDLVAGLASDAVASALAACPPAALALVAVKAWARRRGLTARACDAFPSLALGVLVASLVQRGTLLPGMSAVQATRAVAHFLAHTHLAAPSGGAGAGGGKASKATAVVLSGMSAEAPAAGGVDGSSDDHDDDDAEEGYQTGDSDGMDAEGDDDEDEDGEGGEDSDDGGAAEATAAPSGSSGASSKRISLSSDALAAHRAAFQVCILFHDASTGVTVNVASRVSAGVARELKADAGILLHALSPLESRASAPAPAAAASEQPAGEAATSAPSSSAGSAPLLAHEAAAALFERIFAEPASPSLRYDRIVVVPLPACPALGGASSGAAGKAAPLPPSSMAATSLAGLTDAPTWAHAVATSCRGLLAQALTDRVTSLRVVPVWPAVAAPAAGAHGGAEASTGSSSPWPQAASVAWPLSSAPPAASCLWVCITIDPTNAHRNVDRGPAPEAAAAAAAFNRLWGVVGDGRGGLSELRRFADGVIVHAVVWDTLKLGGRVHARDAIVPLIVAHTLNRHVLASPQPAARAGAQLATSAVASKPGGKKLKGAGAHAGGDTAALLPVSLLHAGDHICVTSAAPTSAAASQLLLQVDVGRAAPSLGLERVLDAGGCVTATAVVAPDAAKGGAVTSTAKLSAATAPAFSTALTLPVILAADALSKGPAAAFSSAQAAFEALSSALLHARGMPLRVSAVTHASAALRGTSMHAPSPHPLAARLGGSAASSGADGDAEEEPAAAGAAAAVARLGGDARKPLDGDALLAAAALSVATAGQPAGSSSTAGGGGSGGDALLVASQLLAPLPVVATLESSSKWPDDPNAIAALKAAFLLKLKYSLSSGADGTLPRGTVVAAEARPDGLRVLLGGYCFVVHVHHARELALLERAAKRGPLARAPAAGAPAPAPVVRGFVNVAPAGINDPEAPLTKRQRAEALAASGKARVKGTGRTQPLASSDGMAVLRAQLGLGPSAAAAAALPSSSRRPGAGGAGVASSSSSSGADGDDGGDGAPLDAHAAGRRLDGLFLRCVAAPRHSAAIATLTSRFSAYGPTVRLAALWLASAGLAGEEGAGGAGVSASMAAPALVPPLAPALRVGAPAGSLPEPAAVVDAYHASLAACADEHAAWEGGGGAGAGPHVRHELLELLVAHVFTSPGPAGAPPASASVGLLRLLRLLGHHDWVAAPLLVDPDISNLLQAAGDGDDDGGGDAPSDARGHPTNRAQRETAAAAARAAAADSDARTLASRFRAVRAGEVAMGGGLDAAAPAAAGAAPFPLGPAMYVVTPTERGAWRPLWGAAGPDWPVLGRLVLLARAAEGVLARALAPVLPAAAATAASPPLAASGARGCVYSHATSLASLYQQQQQQHATSPFDIFSGGVAEADGGAALVAAGAAAEGGAGTPPHGDDVALLAPYHAAISLRAAVASRWGVDGRAFGPVKPPVALAAALWHAPLQLPSAHSGGAAAVSPALPVPAAPTPPPPHLQLVVATAARPHGARKQQPAERAAGGAAAAAVGAPGSQLVLPGGLPEGSRLTLPLHRNLLARSREALCVGFEPAACLLGALRARLGAHALFFLQPPHHAATARALLAAAGAGGAPTPAAPPLVGVVWRNTGGLLAAAAAAGAGAARREPTALALATVPLMASVGAGVVRSVTMV